MPQPRLTKEDEKRTAAAWEGFQQHYAAQWGSDRWHGSLLPALMKPTQHLALVNIYASRSDLETLLRDTGIDSSEVQEIRFPGEFMDSIQCLQRLPVDGTPLNFPPPARISSSDRSLQTHWNLDAASALVAHILDVHAGHSVLDMCAAPGGKSIALAQNIWPGLHSNGVDGAELAGCLHSNEIDATRGQRLGANLKSYLPSVLISKGLVKLLRVDGAAPHAKNSFPASGNYDRVLVDAPCSAERHVVHAYVKATNAGQIPEDIVRWKPRQAHAYAKTQAALLFTALQVVRMRGKVVYATCSIDDTENDAVVTKVLAEVQDWQRRGKINWTARVHSSSLSLSDWTKATQHGHIGLPDHPSGRGAGPLYFTTLEKIPL